MVKGRSVERLVQRARKFHQVAQGPRRRRHYVVLLDEHITTLDQMADAERARKKEEYANPSEYERAQAELKIIIDKVTTVNGEDHEEQHYFRVKTHKRIDELLRCDPNEKPWDV